MTTQTEITQRNHHRAVRFFWGFLIGATTVSLIGNIAHAVLPYLSRIVVQIGAAAVPPIALLAAVHGIALAVRAGASGRVYRWAVSAVAVIGLGAFAVSFLALRDLMRAIGYSSATAWIFPAIIDTAVAVSTMMLVALGDKQARRARTVTASASAQVKASAPTAPAPVSAPVDPTRGTGACVWAFRRKSPDTYRSERLAAVCAGLSVTSSTGRKARRSVEMYPVRSSDRGRTVVLESGDNSMSRKSNKIVAEAMIAVALSFSALGLGAGSAQADPGWGPNIPWIPGPGDWGPDWDPGINWGAPGQLKKWCPWHSPPGHWIGGPHGIPCSG